MGREGKGIPRPVVQVLGDVMGVGVGMLEARPNIPMDAGDGDPEAMKLRSVDPGPA